MNFERHQHAGCFRFKAFEMIFIIEPPTRKRTMLYTAGMPSASCPLSLTSSPYSPSRISVLQDERVLARSPWLGDIAAGIQASNIIISPNIPEFGDIGGEALPRLLSAMITEERPLKRSPQRSRLKSCRS